jgi:hypothetical protein
MTPSAATSTLNHDDLNIRHINDGKSYICNKSPDPHWTAFLICILKVGCCVPLYPLGGAGHKNKMRSLTGPVVFTLFALFPLVTILHLLPRVTSSANLLSSSWTQLEQTYLKLSVTVFLVQRPHLTTRDCSFTLNMSLMPFGTLNYFASQILRFAKSWMRSQYYTTGRESKGLDGG